MSSMYSIPLKELVEEFSLEIVHKATDYEKIRLTVEDVSRPGLQLAGYFDHFAPMRLQVMGNVEASYIEKLSEAERAITFDRLMSYKFPAFLVARDIPVAPQMLEMAKCDFCGKGVTFGIKVSHSHRRSNRTWKPNVKRVKAVVNGTPCHVYACTRCLRSNKVERAI